MILVGNFCQGELWVAFRHFIDLLQCLTSLCGRAGGKIRGERSTCQTCAIFLFVLCQNWRVRATRLFPCSHKLLAIVASMLESRLATSRSFYLSGRGLPWRCAMWSFKIHRPNFGSVKIAPSNFTNKSAFLRALQSTHGPGPGSRPLAKQKPTWASLARPRWSGLLSVLKAWLQFGKLPPAWHPWPRPFSLGQYGAEVFWIAKHFWKGVKTYVK